MNKYQVCLHNKLWCSIEQKKSRTVWLSYSANFGVASSEKCVSIIVTATASKFCLLMDKEIYNGNQTEFQLIVDRSDILSQMPKYIFLKTITWFHATMQVIH